ncbi:MAG: DUF1207 domain-containing protein [Pirellulales bacterium]
MYQLELRLHKTLALTKPLLAGVVAAWIAAQTPAAHGQDTQLLPAIEAPAAVESPSPAEAVGFETAPAALSSEPTFSPPSGEPYAAAQPYPTSEPDPVGEPWTWQVLPKRLIYPSYLAGAKEPRFASRWNYEKNGGGIWDIALGGRVGLLRYGTPCGEWIDGWQLDMEGAAFPRLDLGEKEDLVSADFRFGIPLTYGHGPFQTKLAFYHLSAHLGDEFMLKNRDVERINYSRNVLVWGNAYYPTRDLRLYGEAGWSFYNDGGSEPWEFQFGVDYSPARSTGLKGTPFAAVNTLLREEVRFGGNLVVQTGWQWRTDPHGSLFRAGVEYFTGKSDQFEFFNRNEEKIGLALWYDY